MGDGNASPKAIFDSELDLINVQNTNYSYRAASVLLISRYSDIITVIKKESSDYIQYIGNTYSEPIVLSYSKMADLFDTSGTILIFYYQVRRL